MLNVLRHLQDLEMLNGPLCTCTLVLLCYDSFLGERSDMVNWEKEQESSLI